MDARDRVKAAKDRLEKALKMWRKWGTLRDAAELRAARAGLTRATDIAEGRCGGCGSKLLVGKYEPSEPYRCHDCTHEPPGC